MRVLINNIEDLNDAFDVIVKGADGVGIALDGRNSLDKANDLVFYLPPISTSSLVTKSVTPIKIVNDAKSIGVNTIEFDGEILVNDIAIIREKLPYIKLIKKIDVVDKISLKTAENYKKYVDAILLDVNIMSVELLTFAKKIIDNCDYVLLKAKVTKDYLAVIKELNPYGIVLDYEENSKLKDFIKAIKY